MKHFIFLTIFSLTITAHAFDSDSYNGNNSANTPQDNLFRKNGQLYRADYRYDSINEPKQIFIPESPADNTYGVGFGVDHGGDNLFRQNGQYVSNNVNGRGDDWGQFKETFEATPPDPTQEERINARNELQEMLKDTGALFFKSTDELVDTFNQDLNEGQSPYTRADAYRDIARYKELVPDYFKETSDGSLMIQDPANPSMGFLKIKDYE